jgi:DNA gyrase subunit A
MRGVDIDDVMRRERLEILEAILAAIDRSCEVSDVVASSETADDARARLRELLGISHVGAMEILNTQWRRLARAERRDIQRRIVEFRGGA